MNVESSLKLAGTDIDSSHSLVSLETPLWLFEFEMT